MIQYDCVNHCISCFIGYIIYGQECTWEKEPGNLRIHSNGIGESAATIEFAGKIQSLNY